MRSWNLRFFVWSGGAWAVFDALTTAFLPVFAIALGASNTIVGVLSAVTYAATFVAELPGARLLDVVGRKQLVALSSLVGRLGWLVLAFVPYVSEHPLAWVVGVFAFIRVLEWLGDPAWTSLAADIVPVKQRGVIFGRRNALIGFAGLSASIVGGFFLDVFPKGSFFGFSSLFVVGVVWALLTFYCIVQIQEPRARDHGHHGFVDAFSFSPVLRRFALVSVLFYFAVMFASPFFTPYMLKDLGLSYSWFVIAGGIATLARIVSMPRMGLLADRLGDKRVALACMVGTALVPFSYIFITADVWLLIIPAQIFSGVVWAGVDLSLFNLLLNYTSRERRAAQSAAFTMVLAVPQMLGPVVGGAVADVVAFGSLQGIPLIFAIASVLRLGAGLLLVLLPEVRVKRQEPVGLVVKGVLGFHPSRGLEGKVLSAVKNGLKR